MKKLLAVILVLLCTSFVFAEDVIKKYETGDCIIHPFPSRVMIHKYDIFKKPYTEYPQRIFGIIPYNDGYLLKLSFSDVEYSFEVQELFVKKGMTFSTGDPQCPTIKIADVRANEIELCFCEPD